ncbi:potassium channel family protein [Seonamhaeicola maritimus]|uniref:potassium channel family protein n=1 Tax=Seonamhaeicola maritimus TaxID=2591822 RepID=UPI0024950C54|nr:potassium channel family protein [Seonamhaeicola maritimus]
MIAFSRISKKLIYLFFLFVFSIGFGQSDDYRIIPSLTDWIEEINNWPDSVYSQNRIKIYFDYEKDKDFIAINDRSVMDTITDSVKRKTINKRVGVSEFQFHINRHLYDHVTLKNIHFKKEFKIYNLWNHRLSFKNCVFDKLHQVRVIHTRFYLSYLDCEFNNMFQLNNPDEPLDLNFIRCTFNGTFQLSSADGVPNIEFSESVFNQNVLFGPNSEFNSLKVYNSIFNANFVFKNNQINNASEIISSKLNLFNIDESSLPPANTYIPFNQISNKVALSYRDLENDYLANKENDFKNREDYDRLIASYAKLLSVYKTRSESESYNACYVEMRKKQTAYSKYILKNNRTFSNYTVYQLNRFMEIFSDYGTKPTKAIIFSIYVILLFALIYLFFPNTWDKHGKNRIINRYTFFLKYMNRKAGIHEVYLDDKKEDIMAYDEYKELVESSQKTVPKFFEVTALPLYKWAISGTKISASILKRVDIMKGTWQEVPQKNRIWKSTVLICAFVIAAIYDIIIKILNALMLSINTFTTLGFGEIPIKGLPRYLAIIQGFIGWFMLTIFSVSLISQLLN